MDQSSNKALIVCWINMAVTIFYMNFYFEKITTKVTHNELKSFLKDQFILDTKQVL